MPQEDYLSPVLRRRRLQMRDKDYGEQVQYRCPGCKTIHIIAIGDGPGERWTFDGNMEHPTFKPSVLVSIPEHTVDGVVYPRKVLCHHYVVSGQINFLDDSEGHTLRGYHPLLRFDD